MSEVDWEKQYKIRYLGRFFRKFRIISYLKILKFVVKFLIWIDKIRLNIFIHKDWEYLPKGGVNFFKILSATSFLVIYSRNFKTTLIALRTTAGLMWLSLGITLSIILFDNIYIKLQFKINLSFTFQLLAHLMLNSLKVDQEEKFNPILLIKYNKNKSYLMLLTYF